MQTLRNFARDIGYLLWCDDLQKLVLVSKCHHKEVMCSCDLVYGKVNFLTTYQGCNTLEGIQSQKVN